MKNFLGSVKDILTSEEVKFTDPETEKRLLELLTHLDADLVTQDYNPSDDVVEKIEEFEKHLEARYDFDEQEEDDDDDDDDEFEDHEEEVEVEDEE